MMKNSAKVLLLIFGASVLMSCSTQSWYEAVRINSTRKGDLPDYGQYQKERKAAEGR